jgi:hypothetical protein
MDHLLSLRYMIPVLWKVGWGIEKLSKIVRQYRSGVQTRSTPRAAAARRAISLAVSF